MSETFMIGEQTMEQWITSKITLGGVENATLGGSVWHAPIEIHRASRRQYLGRVGIHDRLVGIELCTTVRLHGTTKDFQ
jgi:hypothetical protein